MENRLGSSIREGVQWIRDAYYRTGLLPTTNSSPPNDGTRANVIGVLVADAERKLGERMHRPTIDRFRKIYNVDINTIYDLEEGFCHYQYPLYDDLRRAPRAYRLGAAAAREINPTE